MSPVVTVGLAALAAGLGVGLVLGRLRRAPVAAAGPPGASPVQQPASFAAFPQSPFPAERAGGAGRTMGALAGIPKGTLSVRDETPTSIGGNAGVQLGVAIARAHQLAKADLAAGITELERLRAGHARNPAIAAELAKLLDQAGRTSESLSMASEGIRLALSSGAGPIAHDVFMTFARHAAQLDLQPATYQQLATILCNRREFAGASWCHRAAAALGGDPLAAQDGLLLVAEAAMRAEDGRRAMAVCDVVLECWPGTPAASRARDVRNAAQRWVGAAAI